MRIELCSKTLEVLSTIARVNNINPRTLTENIILNGIHWMIQEEFHVEIPDDEDYAQYIHNTQNIDDLYNCLIKIN